jgi:hypothetical protein
MPERVGKILMISSADDPLLLEAVKPGESRRGRNAGFKRKQPRTFHER